VFRDGARTERLCKALADKMTADGQGPFTAIVSPAMGGIIPGYETAKQLGLPFLFVEREDGEFALRRGFELTAADRVLVIEDIVTTGLSSRECIAAIEATGAKVVAEGCLVDRSGGKADVGVPLTALATVNFPLIRPISCPKTWSASQRSNRAVEGWHDERAFAPRPEYRSRCNHPECPRRRASRSGASGGDGV
jgi:orotate phosphoribosyltransferase